MRKLYFLLAALLVLVCCAVSLPAQGALPEIVNTTYDELYPVVNMQGDALYFARFGHPSNRGEQNSSDIWATYKSKDGQWSKPVNIGGPANTREAEWPLGLNTSGDQLLVYLAGKGQLQDFKQTGRFWSHSRVHDIEGGYTSIPEGGFQIAQDNHHLFCALPQQRNPNHRDLFLSARTGAATWSQPQPLPQSINSLADEQSAYLAPDNRTLYFASNRAGGAGGYDLYLTRREGEGWRSWSPPVNLGPLVNTNADELFISIPAAGTPAFVARRPVASNMDILEVDLPEDIQPEAMKLISGNLKIDRESLAGEAEVRLEDTHADRLVTVSAVASDGTYSLLVPAQEGGVVYAELPGYFPVTQSMQTLEEKAMANAMASVDQVPFNEEEQEADIRSLHLHLEQLDSELEQLKEQRQKALSAVRAQNYALDLPLSSDPEIEALRHRYRYFTEVVAHQDTLPDDGYDEAAASGRELEDMQVRFKRYYVHEKAIQEAEREAKEGDRHLWEEQLTFEALQAQAKEELEEELIPEVEKRLIQNMEVPLKVDPSSALTEPERATLEQKAKKLQSQIKDGLAASNAPPPDWVAKGGFQKSGDEPEEWETEVLEGLKTAMHDDVAEALAPRLEERVYNLVEIDGQYQVKKLERSMVRQKLDQQVATQLANERQMPPGEGATEEVAPLVPRASAVAPHYEELEQDLMLVSAEVGRNIPLNSVRFKAGTDRLLPSAYAELNRLLTFLNQHPGLVVEAGAHAASNLTYARALELTEQRAKVITNFLAGNGISAARLHSKGYGKAFPKPDSAFSERIEIRIIGKK